MNELFSLYSAHHRYFGIVRESRTVATYSSRISTGRSVAGTLALIQTEGPSMIQFKGSALTITPCDVYIPQDPPTQSLTSIPASGLHLQRPRYPKFPAHCPREHFQNLVVILPLSIPLGAECSHPLTQRKVKGCCPQKWLVFV